MKVDSIIFDVDGTIWNTTPVVANAWNRAIDKLFPELNHVTAEMLKGQFGKTMDVIANNLFPTLSFENQNKLMDLCCDEEREELENNTKDLTYPDLQSTLKILSEKNPLYIVSNCQAGYIEIVVEKTGIKPFIKDFECYGNTGKNKDENISLLIERNGLKNPVYVGDTQGDYLACQKANVPFIWAAYGFGKPDDDNYLLKIDGLKELLNIL
ncbi:MAG: HAD family hydrolase [Erysipelotrichaceae bacterium]|nr:HAD family hydrolase [Erysipelotrichaceae bacterium]